MYPLKPQEKYPLSAGQFWNRPKKCPSDQIHSARRLEGFAKKQDARQKELETRINAIAEMDRILSNMDQEQAEIKYLRFQLERMVQASKQVSTGLQAG